MKLLASIAAVALGGTPITQNNVLHEDVDITADYEISFDLKLTGTVSSWTNILSFGL